MIGRNTNHLSKTKNDIPQTIFLNGVVALFNRHCKACGKRLTSVRTHGRIGRDQIIHSDTNQYIAARTDARFDTYFLHCGNSSFHIKILLSDIIGLVNPSSVV